MQLSKELQNTITELAEDLFLVVESELFGVPTYSPELANFVIMVDGKELYIGKEDIVYSVYAPLEDTYICIDTKDVEKYSPESIETWDKLRTLAEKEGYKLY